MKQTRQVVLVGHCTPDAWSLTRAVRRAVPGLPVSTANDEASVHEAAKPGALLLINRELDGAFVSADGVALIGRLAQHQAPPALMLVSNREDAQADAERAGAHPGFGKDAMRAPETADRLRAALTAAAPSTPSS